MSQHTLYIDKQHNVECYIVELEGMSMSEAKPRVILETGDWNLIFEGTISEEGKCTIPVKKLKSLIKEGTTGIMKIEILADDTLLIPFEGTYKAVASKKAVLEFKNPEKPNLDKPKATVKMITNEEVEEPIIKENTVEKYTNTFFEIIKEEKLTKNNLASNRKMLSNLIEGYITQVQKVDKKVDIQNLIKNIIKTL